MDNALKAVTPEVFEKNRRRVRGGFWPKVRATIGKVPFVEDAVAAYYCAVDRKTPVWVRATIMGALAYFVMPADMIPDFVAGFGFTDDASVILIVLRSVAGHVKDEHRTRAREALAHPEDLETGRKPEI
jgi:uncharacterized membrane protein YkvA (DUF1232 family)